ncbi:hypothetical protein [Brevibacterium aurantiacum]|uniref:hypothetical protein n=1 Tax=Brevibacterium aurantiacum TaxID=273384 RepID=UPI003F93A933
MYGVDLAQLIADRRFIAALDYIDGLPKSSRMREAMLDDREYAEMIVANESSKDRSQTWNPTIAELSPELILLSMVYSAVERNTSMVAASAQGKGKYKPQPAPSPVTEVDRERERRRHREVNRLFDMFTAPSSRGA